MVKKTSILLNGIDLYSFFLGYTASPMLGSQHSEPHFQTGSHINVQDTNDYPAYFASPVVMRYI